MKTDCIFVGNNPGSFNSLFPVILEATRLSIKVSCFIVNYGRQELEKAGIPFTILDKSYNDERIKQLMCDRNPGVVITGSSFPHTPLGGVESLFIHTAKSLGIPSISILDHWFNYRIRFSSDSGKTLDRIPDIICVPDDWAKKEMIAAGFPEKALIVTGSPYLERLWAIKDILKNIDSNKIRKKFGFKQNDLIVTFISEPVSKDHDIMKWGYDEDIVLQKLIDVLEKSLIQGKVRLVVKPHPREDKKTATEPHNGSKVSVSIYNGANIFDLLGISELIVGMTSMLLIEARLLGLNCISFQPSRTKCHKLPFEIKIINRGRKLRNFLNSRAWKPVDMDYFSDPSRQNQSIRRIIRLIERRIFPGISK